MGLVDIENLLTASMGLDVASIGPMAIARAVDERQAACGLRDAGAYWQHLRGSETELQTLIETVVVPETWFFRDSESFAALARLVRDEWVDSQGDNVVRLLSLPCSTGEEPYSMAMALLDAGVPADRFRIDAVDISTRSLALAARGLYGKNSFRTPDLGFREKYFNATTQGYSVKEQVRRQVDFQQGNFFADDLLPGAEIYDAIFCRNVLIYFDRPTQDRAMLVLKRLLKPLGALFVAPAETALPSSHGFASTNVPLAFAFRRVLEGSRAARPDPAHHLPPSLRQPVARLAQAVQPPKGPLPVVARRVARPAKPTEPLEEAARLADQGHFAEAATACEAYMRRHGASATAFYLIGLVRDATGNHAEARIYYRKALYLEPNHGDAQLQLALLMEREGDPEGAQVLRNRARRLENTPRPS
jgi:chemotaxis protein methyltransferase WspC